MVPRRSLVLLSALLVMVTAACHVDVDVSVSMEQDGSGRVDVDVVLDPSAAELAVDLDQILVTDDLAAAGWVVDPVESTADGGFLVSAGKPFATAEELRSVLAEIAGEGSLFRDLEVVRDRPFGEIRLGFGGILDPTGGLEQFGDAELTAALGGVPLGVDLAELEADLGQDPASAVSVNLEVVMAGDQDPDPAEWTVRLDETEPTRFGALSTVQLDEPRRWVRWAVVAAVAFVAVAVLELFWVWSRRRRQG